MSRVPMKLRRRWVAALFLIAGATVAQATEIPFGPQRIVSTSHGLGLDVVAGDLDGDGDLDLVASQGTNAPSGVYWYENLDGAGTWSDSRVIDDSAGGLFNRTSIELVDMDRDGDLDLLTGSYAFAAWYPNDGQGNFGARTLVRDEISTGGGYDDFKAADLDGDGDLDVIGLSGTVFGTDKLVWFTNNGGGSFNPATENFIDALVNENGRGHVIPVDLDRDGDLDIVTLQTAPFGGDNRVVWYRNTDGAGTFSAKLDVSTAVQLLADIGVGDFDGDGDLDVVSVDYGFNAARWHENVSGDGSSWTDHDLALSGSISYFVDVADLDLDGDADVLLSDRIAGQTRWVENTAGDGSAWTNHLVTGNVPTPGRAVPADVDGDGDPDIVTASISGNKISWNENRTIHRNAAWDGTQSVIGAGVDGFSVYAIDLDRDGDMDAVSASQADNTIFWHESDGGSPIGWTSRTISTGAMSAWDAWADDVDGDGDIDVLSASFNDDKIAWYENDGGSPPGWTERVIDAAATGATSVRTVDLDRDGDVDVVATAQVAAVVRWYENDGASPPVWTPRDIATSFSAARSTSVADVDGDGDLDVMGAAFSVGTLRWWENDGATPPGWTQHDLAGGTSGANYIQAADIDGDGDVDAFSAEVFGSSLKWHESDGGAPPSFTTHLIALVAGTNTVWTGYMADLDQDGDMDAIGGTSTDGVAWYENSGASPTAWTGRTIFGVLGFGVFAADMDADGDTDVLSAETGANRIAWYENRGGQYGATNADTGTGAAAEAQPAPFLATTFRLNGRPGDPVGDTNTVDLLFRTTGGTPLTTPQAAALFGNLSVYRDDGSGAFEPAQDTLLTSVAPALTAGVQSVAIPDSPNSLIAAPATFFVVGQMTANASAQSPSQFTVTHLSEQSALVANETSIVLQPEYSPDFKSQTIYSLRNFIVDATNDAVDANPGDGICATAGGQCTLRAAVQESNAAPLGPDKITLGSGTYVLTIDGGDFVSANGPLDVRDDLILVGQGPANTTIDASALTAQGSGGILRLQPTALGSIDVTVRGLALTGGNSIGCTPTDCGIGAIEAFETNLTIDACDIHHNTSDFASAIFAFQSSSVVMTDSVVRDNVTIGDYAGAEEGAVYVEEFSFTAVNTTFSNNTGEPGSAAIVLGEDGSIGTMTVNLSSVTIIGSDKGVVELTTSPVNLDNSIVSGTVSDTEATVNPTGPNLIGGGAGLQPLGDYGGPTLTHALKPASPVIDAGSCGAVTTDQRGVARPVDIAGIANFDDGCDLGAHETQVGRTEAPLEVPVRWCGVRGAPSIENPGLLGAGTVNDLLRRRHETATANVYRPQGNIVFRSAANDVVVDYPVLDDPDCTEGPPSVFTCERGQLGDVFIKPDSGRFDEFEELIARCRAAWFGQDPDITGITAIHINRFIDAGGTPLTILGLGGRAQEGDATEQQSAGRVMVVDHLYRRNVAGNPDTPPNPDDPIDRLLGHELGHAVSLRHGNGVDDDGNGTVDDDDDRTVGKPRFDGRNLMQYRAGAELTPPQVAQARSHIAATVPDVQTQPLVDSIPDETPIDPKNAGVLDFGFGEVLNLADSRLLEFKNAGVLDFENAGVLDFKNAGVLDFENARVLDFKNAGVLDFKNAGVLDFGMSFRGTLPAEKTALHGTTGALPWPAALRPATRYYFFLDVDRSDATGAYPRDKTIPGEAPRRFPGRSNFVARPNVAIEAGVDLIAVVELSSACPADECTSTSVVRVYDYNDGSGEYEEIAIPDTVPTITPIGVGLYQDNGGQTVEADTIPTAITIQPEIPNSVLFAAGWGFTTPGGGDPIPDPVRMEVLTTIECSGDILNDDPASGARDCQCLSCGDCPDYPGCTGTVGTPDTLVGTTILAESKAGELTFRPPVLPSCAVFPALAGQGDTVTVYVTDLPPNAIGTPEVTLDDTALLVTPLGMVDANGTISLAVSLPSGASGDLVLSAGIQASAPRAQCVVTATPDLACPDNDGDGTCDAADADDDNDGVADGSDDAPTNPRVCRDTDADLCDDCSSGADDPAHDGPDFDLDGLCDRGDPDDDNDGVPDVNDGEPFNANACGDTDADLCDDCVINATPTPGDDGPDVDADGLCDFGDPDDDNDGTDDYEDCAPLDGTLRRVPTTIVAGFTSSVRLVWNAADFGTATTSDVLRGELDELPVGSGGSEVCLDDETGAGFFDDATLPASGQALWYLIRATNACGAGGYGNDSSGNPRISATCP